MSKSNKTYIIIPEYGLDAKGRPIDLVAEVWQDDGRWVVGERSTNGNVIYHHGSYPSLESVASEYNTTPAKLRQQTKRIEAERAAPEMLEALKAALATLKSAGIQKDVRQQCEAVIASAEGRAS